MLVGRVVFVFRVAVALVFVGCGALALEWVRSYGGLVVFALLLFVLRVREVIVVVLIVIRSSSVIIIDFSASIGELIVLVLVATTLVREVLRSLVFVRTAILLQR